MKKIINLLKLNNYEELPDTIKGRVIISCFLSIAILLFAIVFGIAGRNFKIPLMMLACIIIWFIYLYMDKMLPFLSGDVTVVKGKVIREPSSGDKATPQVLKNMSRSFVYFRDENGRGYQMPAGKSKGLPFEGAGVCVYYKTDEIPQINRGFIYIASPILWETFKNI